MQTHFFVAINCVSAGHECKNSIICIPGIKRLHSRDQHPLKFMGTKERVYMRKEFNSDRIGLEHQHGRRFIVLEHPYGRRDVM